MKEKKKKDWKRKKTYEKRRQNIRKYRKESKPTLVEMLTKKMKSKRRKNYKMRRKKLWN